MVHKIKYFEADKLKPGIFLQDAVNDFLAEKDEKIIAVHPVMSSSIIFFLIKNWTSNSVLVLNNMNDSSKIGGQRKISLCQDR
jgi:hypothetical protein